MQIVIDIPKQVYDRFREKDHIKQCDIGEYEKALYKCIILPKGCIRLIDIGKYEKKYANIEMQYDDGNHIHSVYTSTIPSIIDNRRSR